MQEKMIMKWRVGNAKNQKQMLESCTLKNAFDSLITRLEIAWKRISECEEISIEISKTEMHRKE